MNPTMHRFDSRKILILLSASVALTGCDTIASWFPDKQKQYQYSTEIPPLEVPPDLSTSTIDGAKRGAGGDSAYSREALADRTLPVAETPEENPVETDRPKRSAKQPKRSEAVPTLAQSSDDVPLIEIEVPFELAWVEVAKALGRMELEITDQNRSDGIYYVYYGGDRKPYEDRGFFGDMAEVFGASQEVAKEYRIKLEQRGKATSVYILDSDNKPQTSGPGFDLLKKLHETLQSASASGAKPASEKSTP